MPPRQITALLGKPIYGIIKLLQSHQFSLASIACACLATSVFQYALYQNLWPSSFCLWSQATQPHLMRALRTLARLRSALSQSVWVEISRPKAWAISFRDLASSLLSGRQARTDSWLMAVPRDVPSYCGQSLGWGMPG
jgi:hypothetical protein